MIVDETDEGVSITTFMKDPYHVVIPRRRIIKRRNSHRNKLIWDPWKVLFDAIFLEYRSFCFRRTDSVPPTCLSIAPREYDQLMVYIHRGITSVRCEYQVNGTLMGMRIFVDCRKGSVWSVS